MASSGVGSASLDEGMPSARLKISKGRAQGGLRSSSGALDCAGAAAWCSSARAWHCSSACDNASPPLSLVQPVIQQNSAPASSDLTLCSTHCTRCRSPSARASA